jgi:hypothetical protein
MLILLDTTPNAMATPGGDGQPFRGVRPCQAERLSGDIDTYLGEQRELGGSIACDTRRTE